MIRDELSWAIGCKGQDAIAVCLSFSLYATLFLEHTYIQLNKKFCFWFMQLLFAFGVQSHSVSNVGSFRLPDPAGRAGGALTSALLNTTYADHADTGADLSFKETLMTAREKLKEMGFEQIPQLSASRPTDLDQPFSIIPPDFEGARRAVMIGVSLSLYLKVLTGTSGALIWNLTLCFPELLRRLIMWG